MRALRWLASSGAGIALVALLAAPASAAKPVTSGEFTGDWLNYSPDPSTCSIAIDYRWDNASGIDFASVQFQMKAPAATEWTNVGSASIYDPPGIRRTYSQTFGVTVAVTGTAHVFRALGVAESHHDAVIAGTSATSPTSPTWNCG